MKTITYEDGNLTFIDGDKKKRLLDMVHLMTNRSRHPMQYLSDGDADIFGMLSNLTKRHVEVNGGRPEEVFSYYLLDILAVSYLITTSVPLKVLEIGATSGFLSYHLATLMGKLNKESRRNEGSF